MKNYLAKHYEHYYILTENGQSIETTRDKCFAPDESPTAENPYKQRWFYDGENYSYIVRLPRSEQGEALYRVNAADVRKEQRHIARKFACVFKGTGNCNNDCDNCQRKRYPRIIELDKPMLSDGENDDEPQYFEIAVTDEYFLDEENEETGAVLAAVAQLTQQPQRLIQLYYYEGKTECEIAAVLNVSQQAINKQLKKIKIALKNILQKLL